MLKKFNFILIIGLSFLSCKSSKIDRNKMPVGMTAKNIIQHHYDNSFDKETVIARLKIKYIGKNSLPGVTASLRIKKDEIIWISLYKLGFPVGKALITKNRVSYYEKINRTYFDGDFTLLSKWLGTELDFDKVQNLLLGQAILDLKTKKYTVNLKINKYQLTPKKSFDLFNALFLINPDNFKIDSQKIYQKNKNKSLTIQYNNYVKVDNEDFPKKIHITASDKKNKSIIDINYRSIGFNDPVSFPFKIPRNYKQMVLK
jgi:hypothetical protein